MKTLTQISIFGFVCLAGLVVGGSRANAQISTGRALQRDLASRPTVSPYLQLTRDFGGNTSDLGTDYFTRVRPQIEGRRALQTQQREIQNVQRELGNLRNQSRRGQEEIFQTGHPTRFMTYSHYYAMPQTRRR